MGWSLVEAVQSVQGGRWCTGLGVGLVAGVGWVRLLVDGRWCRRLRAVVFAAARQRHDDGQRPRSSAFGGAASNVVRAGAWSVEVVPDVVRAASPDPCVTVRRSHRPGGAVCTTTNPLVVRCCPRRRHAPGSQVPFLHAPPDRIPTSWIVVGSSRLGRRCSAGTWKANEMLDESFTFAMEADPQRRQQLTGTCGIDLDLDPDGPAAPPVVDRQEADQL